MSSTNESSRSFLPRRVNVIGVPISATNLNECIAILASHVDELRGEYVCVSNVHTTVMAHDDPNYMDVQAESALTVPDGKPLSVLGSRVEPNMGRVTGPDLMRELFSCEAALARRHFFYGNTEENLGELMYALRREHPNLRIVGHEASVFRDMSFEEESALVERINESGADFIWVGLGAPRQEKLCHRLKGKVNGVMIGVGGAFNILAGITPEAPRWMQSLSLEWLYRLIQEPGRLFRRYAVTNTKFILYVLAKTPPRRAEMRKDSNI